MHGNIYQLKVLMLFLHRGVLYQHSFRLGTEIEEARKFDDLVFEYIQGSKKAYRFLQAKHTQDEDNKKIGVGNLLTKDKSGEFGLAKYFISYLKIKNNQDFADGNLKDFIICTNIDFDLDQSTAQNTVRKLKVKTSGPNEKIEILVEVIDTSDVFFKDGGTRYKFSCTHDNMISIMQPTFKGAVEEMIKELEEEIEKLQSKPDQDSKRKLERNQTWQREFGRMMNEGRLEDNIKEFFDKLVFAVNQPNEIKLADIIKSELGEQFNDIDRKNVYARFQEKMLDWLKEKGRRFLTHEDGREFFRKMKEEILGGFRFEVRNPVGSFTGRKTELEKLHESIQESQGVATVISQLVSISGLGGIGKTELAKKYIEEHSKDYDNNIIWIKAETHETMVQSFLRLARDPLGIPTEDRDIESIVRDIYAFFAKRKSLFVFDNAEEYRSEGQDAGISQFLPSHFLSSDDNKPSVLITSRNQKWGDIKSLTLGAFTEPESMDFIRKALGIKDESQENEIKNLAETLQHFPLALQQAVVYIKERDIALKNVGLKFEISDYLKRYKKEAEKLLDFKFPKDSDNSYTKTTFITWKITINKIKDNAEYGQQAKEILDIIAYIASDNIPVEMFLGLERNREKLGDAIQLLKQYSMVNSGEEQSSVNVHRLVQQVTRIELEKQGKDKVVKKTFELLEESFPYGSDKLEDYAKKRQLLPHLETFLSHIDDWLEKNPLEKQTIEKYYLEDLLICMDDGYHDLGNPRRQKELLERVLPIQEKHYGPDHPEIAITLANLGNADGTLGDSQKAKALLEQALAIKEKHYDSDHFEVARTLVNLGNAHYALGDSQKAKELLEQALPIFKKHYSPDHPGVAKLLANLGNAYGDLGNPQKQKELLEQALIIDEKYYGFDHLTVAMILVNLGIAYGDLGNPQKAKKLLERALPIFEKHYGSGHFQVAKLLTNLGAVYRTLGNPQKAKELLERALVIQEKHYGPDHFEVARTLINLGNACGTLGNHKKKKELLEQALSIFEKYYSFDHFQVAKLLTNLGAAYRALGNPQKAKELLERALVIQEKHYGPDHFEVAITLTNLGIACGDLGDPQKQKELLERALAIKKKHYRPNHFEVARALVNLGNAYKDLGNPQKAKELLEQALAIQKKHYSLDHFEVARILRNLGMAYGALGDHKKKKKLLEQALPIFEKHYGPCHIQVAKLLANLSITYGDLDDPQKAKELFERALPIFEKHYGPDHPEVATLLINLSDAYGALGNHKKQKELFARASSIFKKHYGPDHPEVAKLLAELDDI
ncbi:tetratricopeptide repeat protein [Wolbachia endosymbiont (group A) of Andrena dorsata]|uniref:tetratricopeptide repeat protein n=1 Tax=Wolbachia endosymbiont (group A) of Andrena dorsata TaxID=2953975 RepID=UPI0022315176|nr:tetratricopeptide repeat protein [Wolbachia endosymbiont (group A) of Andrena dorsata]